jgi:hypothetical protein
MVAQKNRTPFDVEKLRRMESDPNAPKSAFKNTTNQTGETASAVEEEASSHNESFKSDDDFGLSQSNLSMSTVAQPRFGAKTALPGNIMQPTAKPAGSAAKTTV